MGARIINRQIIRNPEGYSASHVAWEIEHERRRMGPQYWIIGQIDELGHETRGPFQYKADANKQLRVLEQKYPDLYLAVRKV